MKKGSRNLNITITSSVMVQDLYIIPRIQLSKNLKDNLIKIFNMNGLIDARSS